MALLIPGYTFNEVPIFDGSKNIIFSGIADGENKNIVAKLLKNKHPSFNEIAQFKHEYETAKIFNSVKDIVQVYSFVRNNEDYAIIMENISFPTLGEILDREKKIPLGQFLELAIQITEALGQIHQFNIIHKDINPTNIMWDNHNKKVKIIDFGISVNLPKERVEITNPDLLEGTLPYVSPEQTGRMNRGIDYRTDFYSLGITFYQMLTGQMPFVSDDSMKLIHSHIAMAAKKPNEIDPAIPETVSDIIMKLIEKKAEDRYQNTNGIIADLTECLNQFTESGQIKNFPIGTRDIFSRFQIPEKLYGRDKEINTLLKTYDKVIQGGSVELMLVSGHPGIGKSVLVHEIHKPIVKEHGYIITGKFDVLKHNIPYSAITDAFNELIKQLLTESEKNIESFKKKILKGVGENGKILTDLIPNLVTIIGEQPPVPDYGATENQNLLSYVFQNFIKSIASPEHPLVIFLDDLQWADSSSFNLLEFLLASYDCHHLFIIGSYRSNELPKATALLRFLKSLRNRNILCETLELGPLLPGDVGKLLADTLHRNEEELLPLTEICFEKTKGNPFFLIQLLQSLNKDQSIAFDHEKNRWTWQYERIKTKGITDNVAKLMIEKLSELNEPTQTVLKYAACIGNQFNIEILANICNQEKNAISELLQEALKENFIVITGNIYNVTSYEFSHDNIQEAAYSLSKKGEKKSIHLAIAKFYLQNNLKDKNLFDIANHFNAAIKNSDSLILSAEETNDIISINLEAAKNAKDAGAFDPALNYAEASLALVESNAWKENYLLTLEQYTVATEAAYLSANYDLMDQYAEIVLINAKNLPDKFNVIETQIFAKVAQNNQKDAIEVAIQVLSNLGINIPRKPGLIHILWSMIKIRIMMLGKKVSDLFNLPEMTDPNKKAAIKFLSAIYGAAYSVDTSLFPALICASVILSLKYGNAKESALAYAGYGMMLSGALDKFDRGYQFGQLALELVDKKYPDESVNVKMPVYAFINPWKDHMQTILPILTGNFEKGLDTGNFEFAGYSILDYIFIAYITGEPLSHLMESVDVYKARLNSIGQVTNRNMISIFYQGMINLVEPKEYPGLLVGKEFDEVKSIPKFIAANDHEALVFIYFNKLFNFYLFEDYPKAYKQIEPCNLYAPSAMNFLFSIFKFYEALTLLSIYSTQTEINKKKIVKSVNKIRHNFKTWAKNSPLNYANKHYLLEAEWSSKLKHDNEKALAFYDQAIEQAKLSGFLNEEALANELASKFYMTRGNKKIARAYMEDAYYCYLLWGAEGKVAQLEKNYSFLLEKRFTEKTSSTKLKNGTTDQTTSKILDISTIIKATQTISKNIELTELLKQLMQIVIENAGAQKSFLLLNTNGKLLIQAEGHVDKSTDRIFQSIEPSSDILPVSIINYVMNTKETVCLDNASNSMMFMKDEYIEKNKPKSLLCMPLLNQNILSGILFMENDLTESAFSKERVNILELLSSHIAISIDNARLYGDTKELNEQLMILIKSYERFVPHDFLSLLHKDSIIDVKLGDQMQENMTVLFADIREFTTRSEKMSPQENFNFVNSIFMLMAPIIRKHHGFIDKYIGDAIMSLFPKESDDALKCALEMQEALKIYNDQHPEIDPVKMGIGINTGSLMLGTVGEQSRMNVTVISDAVNVASRVESLTKDVQCPILFTEEVFKKIKNPYRYVTKKIDKLPLKGKEEEIVVYELIAEKTMNTI